MKYQHRLAARSRDEIAADMAAAHPDGVRWCRDCLASLPLSAFRVQPRVRGGLESRCRSCSLARRTPRP